MKQVGGFVTESFIDHLKFNPFVELVSFDEPFVLCKDCLIAEVLPTYKLYLSENAELVIMSGDSQLQDPAELYELCNTILDVTPDVGKLDCMYTCGGYHREQILGQPKVYGVSNNPSLFRELDRLGIREIGY